MNAAEAARQNGWHVGDRIAHPSPKTNDREILWIGDEIIVFREVIQGRLRELSLTMISDGWVKVEPTCSLCGTELVNENCPNYGSGPNHQPMSVQEPQEEPSCTVPGCDCAAKYAKEQLLSEISQFPESPTAARINGVLGDWFWNKSADGRGRLRRRGVKSWGEMNDIWVDDVETVELLGKSEWHPETVVVIPRRLVDEAVRASTKQRPYFADYREIVNELATYSEGSKS